MILQGNPEGQKIRLERPRMQGDRRRPLRAARQGDVARQEGLGSTPSFAACLLYEFGQELSFG